MAEAPSVGPVKVSGPEKVKAVLEFRSMVGTEQLSQPFRYDLEFLSDEASLLASQFLGERMSVHLDVRDNKARDFNGIVTDFSLRGSVGQKTLYAVTLRPWLWLLTQRVNSKIHTGTVPQIVKKVFDAYTPYASSHEGPLDDIEIHHEFVVQYEESDFNFVMRLLEQDGLYFYFTHTPTLHTMVLTASDAYKADGYAKVEFFPPDANRQALTDHIDHFLGHESLAPGVFATKDFDFTAPAAPLDVDVPIARPHALGNYEVFHFPGRYVNLEFGRAIARRRIEALQVGGERYEGQGNVRGLGAGQLFTLTGHAQKALNREYLVYSTGFHIRTHDHQSGATLQSADVMRMNLVALNRERPFRPALRTPKPRIFGVQTAVVVGPEQDEIHTDLDGFGQVKVKFHWDRSDVKDGSNCCWIRVSHAWAGTNFGVIHNPRRGQEVLVEFLDGDPDLPIVTGRVYNYDNMPPFTLPENKTQSGIKTRSTLNGALSNFNEIRFEDKKGSEELFVQAEKTHTVNVKGSRSVSVGGSQSTTVTGKETRTYKKERTTDVLGPDTLLVKNLRKTTINGGRTETVSGGVDELTVTGQNKTAKVELLYEIKTGAGYKVADATSTKLELAGKKILIEAPDKVEIKCGASTSITLTPDTVTIAATNIVLNGKVIKVTGETSVNVKGGGNELDMAASGVKVTSPKEVAVTGVSIKLNS